MGASEVMCVQVTERGKWHVLTSALAQSTPCEEKIRPGHKLRSLELVDSHERCRAKGCIDARNKARGLS